MNGPKQHGRTGGGAGVAMPQRSFETLFDPGKPARDLVDSLAEEQAKKLWWSDQDDRHRPNSTQVRRFFTEIKDIKHALTRATAGKSDDEKDRIYREQFEPRFKMLRSRAAYASERNKNIKNFAQVISNGVHKVNDRRTFLLFVDHIEAVVGHLYGLGMKG